MMTLSKRYDGILGYFRDNVPVAESELHFDSPYQLLVAVMLSAQCTDKRVNMTTPALFSAFPTPAALAEASEEQVFDLIRSISYPNSKSRHLVDALVDARGVLPAGGLQEEGEVVLHAAVHQELEILEDDADPAAQLWHVFCAKALQVVAANLA